METGRPGWAWVREDGEWLAFERPVGVLVAGEVGEVRETLGEVERRVEEEGLWGVGFVAYEAAPAFDRALTVRGREKGGPPFAFFALHRAPERWAAMEWGGGYELGRWAGSVDRGEYRMAVEEVRRRIERGETYQVNYTYRLRAGFRGEARGLFGDLARAQGGEVAAYVDAGNHVVCCASPELFFDLADGRVMTRPMKGTAPRGRYPEEDAAARSALVASEKERAENLMIVDMMRNDLGRVAVPGSVEVPKLFTVERYPTVWQMTSTVTARTGASAAEVFAALFPCASITGAPKAATSGVIAELETTPRGVYTGAVGYFAPEGRGRFAVAIRTAVVDRRRRRVEYGVGGGIVWDSRAEAEAVETEVKARVLRMPGREGFELLETVLWAPGAGFLLLGEHLERLGESARYFGWGAVDLDKVRREMDEGVAGAEEALKVRVLVSRDGAVTVEAEALDGGDGGNGGGGGVWYSSARGSNPHAPGGGAPHPWGPASHPGAPGELSPARGRAGHMPAEPAGAKGQEPGEGEWAPGRWQVPEVGVVLASEGVDESDVFLFHKTTRRGVYERAMAGARERFPEVGEVILWNRRGEVTEGCVSNVVVGIGDELVTPPVSCGLLAGVFRRWLLERGVVRERVVRVEDLATAESIWLVNSVRGWRRGRRLDVGNRIAERELH